MNTPIYITTQLINNEETNSVNARELWKALEIKRKFADWIKNQISSLRLRENKDYILASPQSEASLHGGHNAINYILTLDTAKGIAMASRTPKGEEVRNYFIKVEKQWRSTAQGISPQFIEIVLANLTQLGEVVATLSGQMERLDRRLLGYEQAEAYRREQARLSRARRKHTPNAQVAQAYEGRRAQFLTHVHGVLMQAGEPLGQGELLRRSGYKRDDKTARKWLQEGIGVYWHVKAAGRTLLYRLIESQPSDAKPETKPAEVTA